ncbi:hypothetical protein D9619_012514 [Psilocybe cf. subviscida]|uniref:NACHT domain-containing protein n=1 Tax=Psilocybe cf. subviscida TaxID=2480587 RepID=A0A8H5B7I2_9AGAR|nr:hypothetical protein D9619_012514 [Psilocybe cf. subviscida]
MSPNTSFRSTAATVMQAAPATQEDDSDPEHAFIFNDETNPCVASSSLNTTNYSANINTVRVWDVLHHRVARHAILNTGGWGGDAKCHPGTREEVVTIVERWMDDPDGLSRIMWLNGPAGAGKTAIMRTIADRSKDRGAHTANFFFSREDTTRNHVQPVVVTLLYQISQLFPSAHDAVATVPYSDPLILEASIRQQFNQLLHPLFDVIQKSSSTGTRIVLIIDAFDECDIDAEHNQAQLLYALDRLVTQENSSVLVLVSSRLEAHIQMAFHRLSSRVQSISLDGQYSPDKDIRRFVTAEFRKIKSSHPSAHLLTHDWPAISDIESIVTRSAGQFLYAATVMRFLANSSIVPSHSLGEILAISPLTPNSPFAHLDALYVHILSMMGDHEATRDILSAWEFHERHFNYAEKYTATTIQRFLRHYNPGYTDEFFESWLSDLAAIVQDCNGKLVFYHASLSEFLRDKSRSNEFYIDLDAFCAKVFPAMWRKCVGSLSFSQDIVVQSAPSGVWASPLYPKNDPCYHRRAA